MARRLEKRLTALGVKALTKPGFHADGAGLYLRIDEGRRLWVFRFKRAGVTRWLSLGPDRDITLSAAREAAAECRRQLRDGLDPLEARRAAAAEREEAQARTFKLVAKAFIAAHRAGWRNEKHAGQWESTLTAYAYPVIGEVAVQAVTVAQVLEILNPIWREKPETASRVRGRIEAILDYATARRFRTGENPARWKGHLDHLLPARSKVAQVVHHAAVPWAELPAVMAALAESAGSAARCLRFLILTAARSGEARGARWNEIDLTAKIWTISGDRMKTAREHRVPLSPAALAVLRAAYPPGATEKPAAGLVFTGGKVGRPLCDVALAKALRTAAGGGFTVHGMRSTFREWCAERTSFPREVAETALAHGNRDRVEAAYLRGDHFEKRRRLMEQWALHATAPARSTATVTKLRASA